MTVSPTASRASATVRRELGRGERPGSCRPPSRVGQRAAIGIATGRSAATRLKGSLSLSRVDQRAAIGMATGGSATTRLNGPRWAETNSAAAAGSVAA